MDSSYGSNSNGESQSRRDADPNYCGVVGHGMPQAGSGGLPPPPPTGGAPSGGPPTGGAPTGGPPSGGLPQTGQQLGDEEGGPLGPHLHTIEEENLEAAGQLNGGAGQWNGGPGPGAGQWDGGQGAGAGRGAGTRTVRLRRIHAAHQSIDIMGVGSISRDAMMMEEMTIVVVDNSGAFGSSGQST